MPSSWICLDASFIVGLVTHPQRAFLRERLTQWQAEHLRPMAPALVLYEVANAAFQYQRRGYWNAAAVDDLLEMTLGLPLDLVEDAELHREAIAMARRLSLPATYDAHYLALAERLDCNLWTLDAKLVRRCQGHFDRAHLATDPS